MPLVSTPITMADLELHGARCFFDCTLDPRRALVELNGLAVAWATMGRTPANGARLVQVLPCITVGGLRML